MSEKSLSPVPDDISVVDVYDLASDIGKECEKIIDCYGAEAVTALMPKVVNALEWLESLASRNENENTTIQTLSDRVTYLESEKLERAVYRERLQKVSIWLAIAVFFCWLGKFHENQLMSEGVYKAGTLYTL